MIDPKPRVDSVTNRTEAGDFNRNVAQHFGIHPGGNPVLFVVKKNVPVLMNLLSWIESSADGTDPSTGRRFHRDVPLLVIDDEADQASVDTRAGTVDEDGNPDEDHNPTRINELIRRLLVSFDKSAYVGYTATPFANIFIHEKGFNKDLGEDLFPRSFIINLTAPSNYSGAARVFGIQGSLHHELVEQDPLPIVRDIEDHAVSLKPDENSGWMPPKLDQKTAHIPEFMGKRAIPPSLREAMLVFLLSTAVRAMREPAPQFNSMLIHVVRFRAVQEIVAEEVSRELSGIKNRLVLGDGGRKPTIEDELESIWSGDFIPTSKKCGKQLPAWNDVIANVRRVVSGVEVRTINGSAKDALDYEDHRDSGLTIIAVGGDKLSRGLTLEGLTVSYFLRASKMYDTLMQMGRWFGYRERYLDLCRLYTTAELARWFAFVAAATEELRMEFDYMVRVGATPVDFGLKVRTHPAMLITAAVKMRSGQTMRLSFSGDISETIIFDTNTEAIQRNTAAVTEFLKRCPSTHTGGRERGYLWRTVPVELVLDFLTAYSSHPEAIRANTGLLRRYIEKQKPQSELLNWNVLLASSSQAKRDWEDSPGLLKQQGVGLIVRAQHPTGDKKGNRYSMRRLVSPPDEAYDLSADQKETALQIMRAEWESSSRKKKAEAPPNAAGGRAARAVRAKSEGLLIIYPLDPQSAGLDSRQPIMGIAISFPKSDTATDIEYRVNNVFTDAGDYESL